MPIKPKSTPVHVLEDFRKILAFAASAGDTISEREALDVIKAIARAHVAPSSMSAAVARHVDRVREILDAGRQPRGGHNACEGSDDDRSAPHG
jgi:hypothetical protein